MDAGRAVACGQRARISCDLEGDGTWDRVETWADFATNDLPGWENHTERRGPRSASGTSRALQGRRARLELWSAIGKDPSEVLTEALDAGGRPSKVAQPFDLKTGP